MSEASRAAAMGKIGSFFGGVGNFLTGGSISANLLGPSGITVGTGPDTSSLNIGGDSGFSLELGSGLLDLPDISLPSLPSLPGNGRPFSGSPNVTPGPGYSPNIGNVGPVAPNINPGSGIRPPPRAEPPAPQQRTEAEMREQRVGRARAAELLRLDRRRGATPRASVRGATKAASGSAAAQKSRAGTRLPRPNASNLLGLGNKQATARTLLG